MAWGIWDWQARRFLNNLLEDNAETPVYFFSGHLHTTIVSKHRKATVVVSTSATTPIAYRILKQMDPQTSEGIMAGDAFDAVVENAGKALQSKFGTPTWYNLKGDEDTWSQLGDLRQSRENGIPVNKKENEIWEGEFTGVAAVPRGMIENRYDTARSGVWTTAELNTYDPSENKLVLHSGTTRETEELDLKLVSTQKDSTELTLPGIQEFFDTYSYFSEEYSTELLGLLQP
eukprot:gnl/TRDRNA2_/TRDRNA2_177125_c1_seq1.p2 gnl/TRDRNA2_/TRDRNA2_177125_c1~~gnl/TRDRNA2_/TRDRNA2_177125_c1_seq1.p2  ORF type:complete len:231 (-),score=33.52 gnl/TRDRNA2_/TRDRNA2_177125_c1_seq1:391-1083(-)